MKMSNVHAILFGMALGVALDVAMTACAAPSKKMSAPAPAAAKPGFKVGMRASRPGAPNEPTVDWVDVCAHREGGGHATTRTYAGDAKVDRVVFFDSACKGKTAVPSALCQASSSLGAQATAFIAACAKSGGCDL